MTITGTITRTGQSLRCGSSKGCRSEGEGNINTLALAAATLNVMSLPQMTIERWHHAMCQNGQPPVALCFPSFGVDPRQMTPKSYGYQVECGGRDYDHDRDRPLWHWMRQHEDEVIQFLIALGRCYVVGYGRHPSNATRLGPPNPISERCRRQRLALRMEAQHG